MMTFPYGIVIFFGKHFFLNYQSSLGDKSLSFLPKR